MTARSRFTAGDAVQTPVGKGVVRDIRGKGRLVVDVSGRTIVLDEHVVEPLAARVGKRGRSTRGDPGPESRPAPTDGRERRAPAEVDLHGLTVEEALVRAEGALNAALLGDAPELRFIHGRSGGRIRGALHRWLGQVSTVRAFRLDPHNPGVTIVSL